MEFLFCALIGYVVCSVNPSYIISRMRGFDIREKGSGNAGASNALIVFGKLFGVLCMVFDIAKAYFSVMLAEKLFPDFEYAFAVTGTFCILGHIFSFLMKFKGGKGLACFGGILIYFDWRVFLIMLAAETVLTLVTDYICFVPVTASFAFIFVYGFIRNDAVGALILAVSTLAIWYKHTENFKRIKEGKEMHFSYIWKKDDEMKRIVDNISGSEEISKEEAEKRFEKQE